MNHARNRRLLCAALASCLLWGGALGETFYATLRYRDTGDAVTSLQTALNQLGYSTGGTDGKFGPATEKAVKQFQRANGLSVDGLAGNVTQQLVYSLAANGGGTVATAAPSVTAPPASGSAGSSGTSNLFGGDYATLRYGATGTRVSALQQALLTLGYAINKVDGKYGLATQKAVTAFQRSEKLTADGLAGRRTLLAMEAHFDANGNLIGTAPVVTDAPAATNPPAATDAPSATAAPNSGYTIPTRTLRKGATGADVVSVQTRLAELGYYTGSLDGKYGTGSVAAIKAFQTKNGLTSDGLAGSRTNAVLFSSAAVGLNSTAATATPAPEATPTPAPTATPAVGYTIPARTLRAGYTGADVLSVQQRLAELGYYTGAQNSTYDAATMAAVKAFQTRNNLSADGLAGATTNGVLFGSSAIAADSAATAAPTTVVSYPTLRSGSTGSDVTALQNALAALQYTVTVNGTYDAATKAAVVAFQQRNKLTADGIAGPSTLRQLYEGTNNVTGNTALATLAPGTGTISGPSKSEIKLLHWFDDIKPTIKTGQTILVYDPATSLAWTLRLYSLGRHADSEPLTLEDTQIMERAFGNQNTWNQKAVYVRLPSGVWTVASTHDMPHLSGSISGNGFDGHLCVHFLRDMAEAEKNDPKYGVANQKTIRAAWKSLTGQDYAEVVR